MEAVKFIGSSKKDMAMGVLREFVDRTIAIPDDAEQSESLHSVHKVVTASNNERYDAVLSELGHGDCFWALGLAVIRLVIEPLARGPKLRNCVPMRLCGETGNIVGQWNMDNITRNRF